MFNGLAQLAESPGLRLYVLAIRIQPAAAAAGHSIERLVADLRAFVREEPTAAATLEERLSMVGLNQDASFGDSGTWRLRDDPTMIAVHELPAITSRELGVLGSQHLERIDEIHYRVDIAGLGWPDGSDAFAAVLPRSPE
jgi:hypothetical protein